jgi:hypothetical protein
MAVNSPFLLKIYANPQGFYVIHRKSDRLLVSGVVFSMLVYAIFASEILGKTALFPSFVQCKDIQLPCASGIRQFFYGIRPESPQDIAKIVVWSFISGFAERFVPDVLDRLVKKTDKQ